MPSLFEMPIEELKYIGKKRGQLYRKLGVTTTGELIKYYPRTYNDLTSPCTIFEAIDGDICCIKVSISSRCEVSTLKGGKFLVSCFAQDITGSIRLVFFNNKYIADKLKLEKEYYIYGKVSSSSGIKEMISPQLIDIDSGTGLYPVYDLTAGLTNNIVRRNVSDALKLLPEPMHDSIPEKYLKAYELSELSTALHNIHFPKNKEEVVSARKRLVFEELLILSLGLRCIRNRRSEQTGYVIKKNYCEEYLQSLPFKTSNAQNRVISECIKDMMKNKNVLW